MDAVLNSALQSVPQLGVGGIVVWVVLLLLRRESAAEDRFSAEYARINEAHDNELRELREQIEKLRAQITDLQLELDIERKERRKAEDEAAAVRRNQL